MSLHTKTALWTALALNMSVVLMAFISVDRNVLPTLAVILVPYSIIAWAVSGVSYGLDLIAGR